jgi:hypothetical protein
MCYLCMKRRFFNIRIINAHAPTEDKEEEEKEEFCRITPKLVSSNNRILFGEICDILTGNKHICVTSFCKASCFICNAFKSMWKEFEKVLEASLCRCCTDLSLHFHAVRR